MSAECYPAIARWLHWAVALGVIVQLALGWGSEAIDDAAALREANNVTLQGTLSTLRDLDWAEAIGRYQMENTALQAAQTVFMQMQSLSLFKLMG